MKIRIESCNDPKKCVKCVQICPGKILVLAPKIVINKNKQKTKWKIKALFTDLCDGCMKCVNVCYENRIKIEL
ncbi:hypothetical protein GOV14_00695 [Candidatus Pacearchaeota archaeon]|nr:hypothetical protein [Candidatus Pacearchaeota archaeon]